VKLVATTDWAGISATIAAVGAIVTTVLQYLQRKPVKNLGAAAYDTHQLSKDTNNQVAQINGGGTLGEIADRADTRQRTDDAGTTHQHPPGAPV
jgi:hypothetical protein